MGVRGYTLPQGKDHVERWAWGCREAQVLGYGKHLLQDKDVEFVLSQQAWGVIGHSCIQRSGRD